MKKSYEDLQVWQKGIDLAVHVYNITRSFPADEKYGLISQMRRAAYSVSSNIAEGSSRNGLAEFQHFLSISQGSLSELKTQLIIALRIKMINSVAFESLVEQIDTVGRMLSALRKSLRKKNTTSNQQLETSN